MEKSNLIKDLLVSAFVLGFSFVAMAALGMTEFGRNFDIITDTAFSDKLPLLSVFTAGSIGTYFYLFLIWGRGNESKSNFYFLFVFCLANIISGTAILAWLGETIDRFNKEFIDISFPTEVDIAIKNVRFNLLDSVSNLFLMLLLVAVSCLILGFYQFKSMKND